jgi:hypothetical protein
MTQLDHVILFCAAGAPEAEALRSHGFLEGSGQSHPGQGTTNRRFCFANGFLELLWVEDEAIARSDLVRPTQLWERWRDRGAGVCPFGLVFRPGGGGPPAPPFATWSYHPPYLPPELSIEVGVGVTPDEPLLFHLPFARDRRPPVTEPTDHPAGVRELAGVRLHLRGAGRLSPSLSRLASAGIVSVAEARDPFVELAFAGGRATPLDLRPHLPLVFRPHGALTADAR